MTVGTQRGARVARANFEFMGWEVVYFQEVDGSVPAREYLATVPKALRGKLRRFIQAAAAEQWALGGGIFEVCHDFPDICEVRAKQGRDLARMLCFVDRGQRLILLSGVLKHLDEPTPIADFVDAAARLERFRTTRRIAEYTET